MPPLVIDVVIVSQRINAKLNQRHGLSRIDVEEAIERRLSARLAPNEDGVLRLLLIGTTLGGRRISVVLYPTAEVGVWKVATAFPVR